MNKLEIGMLILVTFVMIIVGVFIIYTLYEQITEYEDEIVEIGPPGITNIKPLVITIGAITVVCLLLVYGGEIKDRLFGWIKW